MRRLSFLSILILIAVGCNDGGSNKDASTPRGVAHPPEIVQLVLSPTVVRYMQGNGIVEVTAEIDFRDNGLDMQAFWVRLPNGNSISFSQSSSIATGWFAEEFAIPTNEAGTLFIEFWLVDKAGDSSLHRTETLKVVGEVENSAGGIWTGTLSDDLTGEFFAMNGVITEDNIEGRFLIAGETLFVLRNISISGTRITATLAASSHPDAPFIVDAWDAAGVMTGELVERTHIEGEWSLDTGQTGTMTLVYDDIYERGSDIERLVGTWESSWGGVFNIDALGEIFEQAEDGCAITGQVELINPSYNVYWVKMTQWCLPWTGTGLGVLGDEVGTDDAFSLVLGESGWYIADTLQRQ